MTEKNSNELSFKKGILDGIPIALGYIPVGIAIAVGIAKSSGTDKLWAQSFLMMLNTISGLAAVIDLISKGETLIWSCIILTLIVNSRYILLSLSLSQKIHSSMTTLQRMLFSFFNTDETFAIAMQQNGLLTAPYLFGLITLPYIAHVSGFGIGLLFNNLIPESLGSALGIILYAMFIAIIIPPTKNSKPVTYAICIAILIKIAIQFSLKFFHSEINPAWIILICAVITTSIVAVLFPVKEEA